MRICPGNFEELSEAAVRFRYVRPGGPGRGKMAVRRCRATLIKHVWKGKIVHTDSVAAASISY